MAIEWDRVGQPRFDRIVEALVHRMYDATSQVEVVNGRGGDAGIDIKVTSGGRLRIFQLKYYPDGFPAASFKGRRKSIRESFERAMRHSPWEWILVVPCTLTTPEREYVDGLAAGHDIRVRVMDRAELDNRLAAHEDLEPYFTRDQLFEAAKVYGQETALLMGGLADIGARVGALGRVIDGLDANWTVDFARQGKTLVQVVRGKHPRAHEVEPIQVAVTGMGALAPDLAEAVRNSLGFGRPEEVVLPRGSVQSLTVTGPEWLSGTWEGVEVWWRPAAPAPEAGQDADVVFLDDQQRVTASYPAVVRHLGRGTIGRSVDVELTGASLQLTLPDAADQPAWMRFTFSLARLEPRAALRLLKVHQRLGAGGRFEVRTGGQVIGGGELATQPDSVLREAEQLRLYAEDLDVVQQHCEQYFPIPEDVRPSDRVVLRIMRLLLEGNCVISPFDSSVRCTLNGQDSPMLRAMLTDEPHPVRGVCREFAVAFAGRLLQLGPVTLFHSRALISDGQQVAAALDAGQADGMEVSVSPVDGEHFRLVLQSAVGPTAPAPVPLGLPGIPEFR